MTQATTETILETVTSLDRAVFLGVTDSDDDQQLRFDLVRSAVELHMDCCESYRAYAERSRFSLSQLKGPSDMAKVPQIPTMAFKRGEAIASCEMGEVVKLCRSSGTQGRRSEIYRNSDTIDRLLGSVRAGIELMGHWHDDEIAVVNLGPDQDEAGDLWFAYVMSLVELAYFTVHTVRGGQFDPDGSLQVMREVLLDYPQLAVLGPPSMMLQVAEATRRSGGEPFGGSVYLVTAGGWKRATGEIVSREQFNTTMLESFGLNALDQVRDAFNQVELNSVMVECKSQRKHVPPWLEVIVRDPWTLEPVGPGKTGLLSYLDPSATSYPCFIIGDDLGRLDEGPCECGWKGRTMTLLRRIKRDEEWGCALKMDRDYTLRGQSQ